MRIWRWFKFTTTRIRVKNNFITKSNLFFKESIAIGADIATIYDLRSKFFHHHITILTFYQHLRLHPETIDILTQWVVSKPYGFEIIIKKKPLILFKIADLDTKI